MNVLPLFQISDEDLLFFHRHLDHGGLLRRVERPLVIYRHHNHGANISANIPRRDLLRVRLRQKPAERVLEVGAHRRHGGGGEGRRGGRLHKLDVVGREVCLAFPMWPSQVQANFMKSVFRLGKLPFTADDVAGPPLPAPQGMAANLHLALSRSSSTSVSGGGGTSIPVALTVTGTEAGGSTASNRAAATERYREIPSRYLHSRVVSPPQRATLSSTTRELVRAAPPRRSSPKGPRIPRARTTRSAPALAMRSSSASR